MVTNAVTFLKQYATAAKEAGRVSRILIFMFVASFAFDFRGSVGGSPIQFMMAGINTLSFSLLALKYNFSLPGSRLTAFLFWGWAIFLLTGSIGAFVNDVHFGHYIRIIYPFALMLEGFLIAWWVVRTESGATTLVSSMIISAIISLFFTLWWGFYFSGKSIEDIRYEILSPLIPFLIVASGYDLIFARHKRFVAFIVLAAAFFIIGISITRGMLLIVGLVTCLVVAAWIWSCLGGTATLPRPLARALFWGATIGLLGVLIAITFAPDVIMRWAHRTLGAGHNITLWTRVAAVVGQWDELSSNPIAWIVGEGFGHSYRYAETYSSYVIQGIRPSVFHAPMWYPGEFMWVTPLYYTGFFVGSITIVTLLWTALRAFRILTILLRHRSWTLLYNRPKWIGVLGYFSFLGLSITANPFITRGSALFMGLTLGLTFTARSVFCKYQGART